MKTEFETEWERDFDSAMKVDEARAKGCFLGCASVFVIIGLSMWAAYWLFVRLAESI